jgi:hypothetical protein
VKALTKKMTALMILLAGGASWDEAREEGYTYNTLKGVVNRGLVIIPQNIEDGLIITDLGREMFPAPAAEVEEVKGVETPETSDDQIARIYGDKSKHILPVQLLNAAVSSTDIQPAPAAEVVDEIQQLIKHDLLHVAQIKAEEAGLEYIAKCLDNNLPVWAEIELSKLTVTPAAAPAEEVEEEVEEEVDWAEEEEDVDEFDWAEEEEECEEEEVEEEKVPGQWEVQSNYMGGPDCNRIYQIYRIVDPAQPQHSGNMEHYRDPDGKGVWHTEAEAQAVCDALNAPPAAEKVEDEEAADEVEGVEYEVTEELLDEVNACCHNGHGCSLFIGNGTIDVVPAVDCNSVTAQFVGGKVDRRLCYIDHPQNAEYLQALIDEEMEARKYDEEQARIAAEE